MKSYLRFLSRNKLYTAIEVVGLSLALAFVIVLSSYIVDDMSVNKALNKCVSEGTFAQYVAQALEQAAGATASYVDGEIVPDGE